MDLRLTLALLVGKTISFLLRAKGSGATAAPGLYALKIDKNLIKKLTSKIEKTVVISGTNGKTTTSRILSDIALTKFNVIHNRQGSNLLRGVASTLVQNASIAGNIKQNLAIWETDEAELPKILSQTAPDTVVLLNLFRDQLDRYGEVENIRSKWEKAISNLTSKTNLILNSDDPQISFIQKSFKGKSTFFGVEDTKLDLPIIENVADSKYCLKCGAKLTYSSTFSAHLGHWSCTKCNNTRQKPQVFATNLKFNQDLSTELQLSSPKSHVSISYALPGLYNVYNVEAATSAALSLGIGIDKIKSKIKNFNPAFGRFQKVNLKDKNAVIFLIKNPAGANEVIRTISTLKKISLLTILNDKLADGKDVSWIWDTNLEILNGKLNDITTSGTRAWDMALRLKYSGFNMSNNNVCVDISYSLEKSIDNMNKENTLIILTTYTAMLELQKSLKNYGEAKWQKQ